MLNTIALLAVVPRKAAAHDQEQLTASRKGRVKRIFGKKGRKEKRKKGAAFLPLFSSCILVRAHSKSGPGLGGLAFACVTRSDGVVHMAFHNVGEREAPFAFRCVQSTS
jgi:hypothetical protein